MIFLIVPILSTVGLEKTSSNKQLKDLFNGRGLIYVKINYHITHYASKVLNICWSIPFITEDNFWCSKHIWLDNFLKMMVSSVH